MATDKNFVVKNGLEVGGVLIVNSSGQLQAVTAVGNIDFSDNIRARFGDGNDLQIYHDGSDSYINQLGTGNLIIRNSTDDKDINFQSDDGSGSVATYFQLDGSQVQNKFLKDTVFLDSVKAKFGTAGDLEIYHNGTDSFIHDNGTGNLNIKSNGTFINFLDNSNNLMAYMVPGGAVGLYHNTLVKLVTTSSGVDITGTLNTSGAIVASGDGHTFYSGGGSSTASFGRNANERLQIYVDDGNITLTADQDSDSNGTHEFILDRTFDGTGTNNFVIKKSGTTQLLIDTNANATFVGEIYAKDSNSTTDPTYTFTGHTTTGMSVSYSGSQDELHFITGGTRRMHLNDAGVTSFANVYTGSGSAFRNYAGVWQGTTGVTGNGFKFVNTADSVTPFNLTSSGQLTLTNQSTTTYMTHLSNGQLRNQSSNGYIEIGPANTSHAHIETDRSNFYFNTELRVDTGVIGSYNEDLYLRRASSASGQLQLTEHKLAASAPSKSDQLVLGGFVAETSLENGRHFYHPGLQTNVLAGLHLRGTVTGTKNGSTQSIGSQPFLAGSEHTSITVANSDVVVITLTGFTGLSYSSSAGIVFGNDSFRAQDIEIETSTDGGTTWTSRLDVTDQAATTVVADFSSGGTATNAIRYTLTNFNSTSLRILSLFAYRYNSHDQYFAQLYKDETIYSNWTFRDDKLAQFGNNNDLVVYHSSSSSSFLRNYTGDLFIQNDQDDGDIYFRGDDGSGGIATYFALDGGNGYTSIAKNFLFQDNVRADFGNGSDLRINHNATNSFITNHTGDLKLIQYADDGDISFQSDDGSGGITEYFRLDGSLTKTYFEQNVQFNDNVKLQLGAGADLSLFHNGTHSYIDNNQGSLYISSSNTVQIENSSGNDMITAQSGGAVTLFYNAFSKLATKSDGVDITGELQADSLDIDGAGDISGNLTIGGNLTVNGSTVTNSATNTTIEDALIELGSGNTGTNSNDLGLILERGTSGNNAFIGFDESDDQVVFALTTATGASTGNLAFSSFLPIKAAGITGTSLDINGNADISGVLTMSNSTAGNMLNMNNNNIIGVNAIQMADPGPNEGVTWSNIKIYESPNDLTTNSAGNFQVVYGSTRRFTVSNVGADVNGELMVNGAHNNNGNAKLAVESGVSGAQISLYSDQIQLGNTSMNYHMKIVHDASTNGNITLWNSNLTIGSQGTNTGSAAERDIIFAPQTSGTAVSTERMRIKGDGNVGIGVNDPDAKLEVNGTTKLGTSSYSASVDTITDGALIIPQPARIISQASTGDYLRTIFTHETSNGHYVFGQQGTSLIGDMIFYPGSSGNMRFYTSGSEAIRFDTNGRIGIGTTSPQENLEIHDTTMSTISLSYEGNSGNGSSIDMNLRPASPIAAPLTSQILFADDGAYRQNIHFKTKTSGTASSGLSTRMIIKPDGNIGIGTTSPSANLSIVDGGSHNNSDGNNRLMIDTNGHSYILLNSPNGYDQGIHFRNNTDGSNVGRIAYRHRTGGDDLQFTVGGTVKATLTSTGRLGIGTDTPVRDLQIQKSVSGGQVRAEVFNSSDTANSHGIVSIYSGGASAGDAFLHYKIAGVGDWSAGIDNSDSDKYKISRNFGPGLNDYIVIDTTGNVGFGTSSPEERIEVNGNVRMQSPISTTTARPAATVATLNSGEIRAKNSDSSDGGLLRLSAGAGTTQSTLSYIDLQGYSTAETGNGKHIFFGTGGADRMVIDGSGNVGIGTSSPSDLLTITGDGKYIAHHDGTNYAFQLGADSSGDGNFILHDSSGNVKVKLYAEASADNYINNGGDFGLGRSDPGRRLDVLDNGDVNGEIIKIEGGANYGAVITYHRSTSYSWEAGVGGGSSQDANIPSSYWGIGERGASGRPARFLIAHTSGNVGINATPQTSGSTKLRIGGTGDPHIRIEDFDGTNQYVNLGHNNGDSTYVSRNNTSHGTHSFYSYNGTSTTLRFKLNANGTASFNNAFTLPSSDGSANQVLITNGSGTVTWGDVSASNADTVDNLHAASFIRSDANDDFSGTLNYTPDTGTILSVDGQAILQRMTANGAITIGHDDAVIIAAGDTSGVLNTNITNANEQVFLGAEGGVIMYAFPNNDITWSNRKSLSFDGANGLNMESVFTVDISGNLSATTKSFDIEHPTKEGMRLHHGVLEGPEHAVYIRGKSNSYIIELPDYWEGLVHEDTITVQLTPIGGQNDMWIENIEDNKVYINCEREMKQYFYFIQAERKDIERFEVEYDS